MGTKKPDPSDPKNERLYAQTKVKKSLLAKAKYIAKKRKIPLADLIDELLDGPIESAFTSILEENIKHRRPNGS